jgi:transposase
VIPAGLRILVATQPIDMRCSIDGLVAAVAERLKQDAASERVVYVFANLKKDRAKLVWRTAHQWCLLYTRLDVGYRVTLPAAHEGVASIAVDTRALAAILDGAKKRATPREIVREARAKVQISRPTSTRKR